MRINQLLVVLAAMFTLQAAPGFAQDAEFTRRTTLARELIALSSGPNFAKAVEQYVEVEMDKASPGDNGAEAAWVRANMPAMIGRMMNRMMADLAAVYAETFTREELEGQIAFYRTPVGRQVAAKTLELGIAQDSLLQGAMTSFMTEFEQKYCAEFNCQTGSGQAAGKPGA